MNEASSDARKRVACYFARLARPAKKMFLAFFGRQRFFAV
jgi:hypothetical protein